MIARLPQPLAAFLPVLYLVDLALRHGLAPPRPGRFWTVGILSSELSVELARFLVLAPFPLHFLLQCFLVQLDQEALKQKMKWERR